MNTIPEAPETIEAQLEWLRQGKRAAVLLTPGCVLPELPGPVSHWLTYVIAEGVLICAYPPHRAVGDYDRGDITLAELLGYGVPAKPSLPSPPSRDTPPPVVVIRSETGLEKQAVVSSEESLPAALAAAQALAEPTDTVTTEDGVQVLEDRLAALDARELKVRSYDPHRDADALHAAAESDAHCPLNPTEVIERGGEIIGYLGVNSLPLYRLWFHSAKMKASDTRMVQFLIENNYRRVGAPTIATIINTGSPFYPVAPRHGYVELPGDRVLVKDL